ncbi:MAG: ABC transporter substrate-binding protein [Candidatus Sumerlaeaceae bacterium]
MKMNKMDCSPPVRSCGLLRKMIWLVGALGVLTSCAPSDSIQREQQLRAPAEATAATTVPAVAASPSKPESAKRSLPIAMVTPATRPTTFSLEYRATPPPPGFPLPFPDAYPVTDIEPGKRGGSFTFVSFGEGPKSFNPITTNESSSSDVIGRMFESLIGFDNAKQLYVPGLLKEWYMEADKCTWILKLREGLKWSDGSPLTADDILFTAQIIYDPNISTPLRDILQVGGKPFLFEKIDDTTVRVRLAQPTGSFLALMGWGPISKKAYEEAYKAGQFDTSMGINVAAEKIVCSGPFRLKQYVPGERVILERNPYYYKYDRNGTPLPYLDTLIFTYAPDMDQMLARFTGGTADGIVRPRPDSIPDLADGQAKGNYTLYDCGPGDGANLFWFNLKKGTNPSTGRPFVDPQKQAWFEDVRFRRAMLHALDKESIIRTELRGLAVSVWGLESPANSFWIAPNLPKYEYDPGRAKALLDEMDLRDRNGDGIREDAQGNKVSFTFITNKGNKVRERVASLMQQDWAQVGVEARPQFLDFNALVTQLDSTYEYEACLLGLGGGGVHPANSMNVYRSSGRTHLFNPKQEKPATPWEAELDRLADQFNATLDVGEQQRIYWRMQEIMAEQLPILPLWTSKVFVAVRNKFGNVKPSALSHELLWNVEEFYVKEPK